MDAGRHSTGGQLMRLTIEIPDHEVRHLLEPIFRSVELEPSRATEKGEGLQVLSIPEAVECRGMVRVTLYHVFRRGDLPTVHMGRRTGITNEALKEYLSSASVRSGR